MPTPAEQFSACIEAIKDSIASITAGAAPKALIIPRFVMDTAPGTDLWPGLLKSPLDLDDNGDPKIHAIQIWYDGLDQAHDAPVTSVDPLLPFGFGFFMAYDIGTDADNSEKRLIKEVSEVMWALAASTDLGMNEIAADQPGYASVMGHNGLRVPRMSIKPTSLGPVQCAIGSLEVRMQSRYVRS